MAITWVIRIAISNVSNAEFSGNRSNYDRLANSESVGETRFAYPKTVRAPHTKTRTTGTLPTKSAFCVADTSSVDIPKNGPKNLLWQFSLDVEDPADLTRYGSELSGFVEFNCVSVPGASFTLIWSFHLLRFERALSVHFRSNEFQYSLGRNPGTDTFKVEIRRFEGSGVPSAPNGRVNLWQSPPPKLRRSRIQRAALAEAARWVNLVKREAPAYDAPEEGTRSVKVINEYYVKTTRRGATLADAASDPKVKANLSERDALIQKYLGVVGGAAQAAWKTDQAKHSWTIHWCGIFAYWCVNHGVQGLKWLDEKQEMNADGVSWIMGGMLAGLQQKSISLTKLRENKSETLRPGDVLYYEQIKGGKGTGNNHYRIVTGNTSAGVSFAEGNATSPHFAGSGNTSCTCGNSGAGDPFVPLSYQDSSGNIVEKKLVAAFCVIPAPACLNKFKGATACDAACPKGYGPEDINGVRATLPNPDKK